MNAPCPVIPLPAWKAVFHRAKPITKCRLAYKTGSVGELAQEGNTDRLRILLEAGADPNYPHAKGTPLQRALLGLEVEAAHLLLDYGAQVDTPHNAMTLGGNPMWLWYTRVQHAALKLNWQTPEHIPGEIWELGIRMMSQVLSQQKADHGFTHPFNKLVYERLIAQARACEEGQHLDHLLPFCSAPSPRRI